MSYNIAEYGWRFNSLRDGETIADLCNAVSVRPNNEAFKRTNTRTHTHKHTHTHTNTHTHIYIHTHASTHTYGHPHTRKHTHTPTDTHRWMQWARMQCVAFRLKSGYRLTPLDISCRKAVQLHSWHPLKSLRLVSSVRPVSAASVSIGLKTRMHYALDMYPFDSLTLPWNEG